MSVTGHYENRSLKLAIRAAGYRIEAAAGVLSVVNLLTRARDNPSDTAAVQLIIDNFDPLADAQSMAKDRVKAASATKRALYVTAAPGKSAEYTAKQIEAATYAADPVVDNIGVFMQARIDATGETAAAIAAEWNGKAAAWAGIGATIAATVDKASQDIDAETDWQAVAAIADTAIAAIEAI